MSLDNNPAIPGIGANVLTLVCRKCTRQQKFPAKHIKDAVAAAAKGGWWRTETGDYVCPWCPSAERNAANRPPEAA